VVVSMFCTGHCLCYRLLFSYIHAPATTTIYTLSLHDALPISQSHRLAEGHHPTDRRPTHPFVLFRKALQWLAMNRHFAGGLANRDRKSTRLNSSHQIISYAVFCLKKKNTHQSTQMITHIKRQ